MIYKNTKAVIHLPDGDTNFFNIVTIILQGDTTYVYKTSLNKCRAWHIDGSSNKKIHDFYKVQTFKRHVSKLSVYELVI